MKEDEDLRNYIAGMLDKMDTDVYEISVASDEQKKEVTFLLQKMLFLLLLNVEHQNK